MGIRDLLHRRHIYPHHTLHPLTHPIGAGTKNGFLVFICDCPGQRDPSTSYTHRPGPARTPMAHIANCLDPDERPHNLNYLPIAASPEDPNEPVCNHPLTLRQAVTRLAFLRPKLTFLPFDRSGELPLRTTSPLPGGCSTRRGSINSSPRTDR